MICMSNVVGDATAVVLIYRDVYNWIRVFFLLLVSYLGNAELFLGPIRDPVLEYCSFW